MTSYPHTRPTVFFFFFFLNSSSVKRDKTFRREERQKRQKKSHTLPSTPAELQQQLDGNQQSILAIMTIEDANGIPMLEAVESVPSIPAEARQEMAQIEKDLANAELVSRMYKHIFGYYAFGIGNYGYDQNNIN